MFKRKGQSIVEYVLVLAAIVTAVIAARNLFVWGVGGSENTTNTSGLVGLYEGQLSSTGELGQALDDLPGNLGL